MFWMTFFIIRAGLNSCTPFINRTVRYALWAATSHYKCLSIKHWLRLTTGVRYTQSYITSMIQTDKLRMVTSDHVTKIRHTRKPHATGKHDASIFYRTGVMGDRSLHCENRNFRPFCSCDLDLDPMTFIYEIWYFSGFKCGEFLDQSFFSMTTVRFAVSSAWCSNAET